MKRTCKMDIKNVTGLFFIILTLFTINNAWTQVNTTTCDPKLDSIKKLGTPQVIDYLNSMLSGNHNCPEDFIYYQLSLFLLKNQQQQKAKIYGHKGLDIALRTQGDFLPDIYNQLGTIYNYEGKNDSSIMYFIESAKILETRNDIYYVALVENNIGMIYNQMAEAKSAEIYYKKSIEKLRSLGDSSYLATILANLAAVQLIIGDTINAEKNIFESLRTGDQNGDFVALALAHTLHSSIFLHNKDLTQARIAGQNALKYAKVSGSAYPVIDALNTLTGLYLKTGDGKNAEKYALENKEFMESSGNMQNYSYVLEYLSHAYLLQGKYKKSREMLQQHISFRDSVDAIGQKITQSELLVKYETEKKENLLLKQNLELEQLTARNQRLLFFSVIILAGLIFAFLFYKSKIKNKELELAKIKSDAKNQITEALLQGEENERLRLSKEIHDGLGSMLTAAHLHLANMQATYPEISQSLNTPVQMVRKTHDECRRVAHNLMPVTLYEEGLQAAISEHISLLESTGSVAVEFSPINLEEEHMSQNLKLFIFRVIQELISNAVKHGNATEIFLQISQKNPLLTITVEDNGNGIDESKTDKGKGLMSLKKNLIDLGGFLDIESKLKEGTSVYIEINMLKW